MRNKSKIRFKLILILMVACILTGFITAYKFKAPSKEAYVPWSIEDASTTNKRFITHDAIVNELKNKQELIPLELNLTEKITISDNWGNTEVFKKLQNVHLVAKGIYSIDLTKISAEKVVVNNNKKAITITAPKPEVKAIAIDEQKSVYETTQNGLLRFGEIKVTHSEHQSILAKAKDKMSEKMNSSVLYDEAVSASELALINLLKSLLGQDDNYSITINFN